MKANEISKYIISLTINNPEEDLTNMKLQKILYYLQGYYLAIFDNYLFTDDIEAWKYGPVVCEEYHTYKGYGNNSIVIPETDHNFSYLNTTQKTFINKVYSHYRQFSAIKLMELTHKEEPWLKTYGKANIIEKDDLKKFFNDSILKEQFILLDKKEERRKAAEFLLADYLYDSDLTELTFSDKDDIYEN
ncbi:putative phage-associated protein [Chryseobacterium ginsenosidimutans]|uniref:Panacea domain-containing protein n=1 Tax=Chryseobacterium ginsenosidimutans TaxID=687846 RepID=UPI0027840143|nr:type II toxin-antitoxin system antitoxin SocA domain-containing protein [Chryseobacterium ginsenosidimutans]MDQ0592177.1 putative phage-associated protein [Chryseobacterium ginsenosidimutans]